MSEDNHSGILNEDSDEELRLFGFAHSVPKRILFFVTIILTGGTILLLTAWKPRIRLALKARKSDLRSADIILLFVSFCIQCLGLGR